MNDRTSSRNSAVCVLLVLAAVALVVSAVFAWRELGGFRRGGETLAARPGARRDLAAIGEEMRGLEARRAALAPQAAVAAAELATLEKKLMPLEAGSARLLKLELLNLAARCGLVVEEIKPVASPKAARDPECQEPAGAGPAPAVSAEAVNLAFLARLPAGEAYRRPLVAMQCRASYAALRRFFSEVGGLSWSVAPVSFGISRPGSAPAAIRTVNDDDDLVAPVVRPPWGADDGRLHLTVVLAL